MWWLRFAAIIALVSMSTVGRAEPPIDLSLHRSHARAALLVLHRNERTGRGMFVGPIYVRDSDAAAIRRTLPVTVRRVMAAPVGPWGMTLDRIGNSFAAGLGLYARF